MFFERRYSKRSCLGRVGSKGLHSKDRLLERVTFERRIAAWGMVTCWLYAGCIEVTCAERGTCPPGSANETSDETSSGRNTGSSTSVPGDAGPSGETRPGDAQAPETDSGPPDAQVCSGPCGCSDGACEDAATFPECTESQAVACAEPLSICILEDEAPTCVECTRDAHCAPGAPTCVETTCHVCDLETHRGCASATPFCVSVAPAAQPDAGAATTPESLADAATPSLLDAGLPELERACVECRNSDDCGAERPFCEGGSCVACLNDKHCTDPAASKCDPATLSCVGCAATGECAHLLNTPACDIGSNTCVECTAAERVACGTNACSTVPGESQFTCSSQPLGSVGSCEPCQSDAACDDGLGCVLERFDGAATQWVCLPRQGDGPGEVDDCTTRPLVGSTDTRSVDSSETATYCHPRRTTCAGYRSFGNNGVNSSTPNSDWCSTDDDCGLPGVDDGLCLPFGGNTERKLCTYRCQVSVECNPGVDCAAIGGGSFACSLD